MLSHPHELVFPAVFISIAVLAFNLLGDGLRDAFDVRLRGRESAAIRRFFGVPAPHSLEQHGPPRGTGP